MHGGKKKAGPSGGKKSCVSKIAAVESTCTGRLNYTPPLQTLLTETEKKEIWIVFTVALLSKHHLNVSHVCYPSFCR